MSSIIKGLRALERRIKKTISSEDLGKNKIREAIVQIDFHLKRLESVISLLEKRKRDYVLMISRASSKGEIEKVSVYTSELRKIEGSLKELNQLKMSLKRVSLRLSTLRELERMIRTLGSAINAIKSIEKDLPETISPAYNELNILSESLNEILAETRQIGSFNAEVVITNKEAEQILKNAETEIKKPKSLSDLQRLWVEY